MSGQRTATITILVVLQILDGLWGVISGCALLAGGGALAVVIIELAKDAPPWLSGALGGAIALIGVALIVFALLDFVLAWGLWALRRWAWWVTMIKAVLSVLGPLLTLLGGNLTSVPTLILNLVIIALLLTFEVQQAMDIRL